MASIQKMKKNIQVKIPKTNFFPVFSKENKEKKMWAFHFDSQFLNNNNNQDQNNEEKFAEHPFLILKHDEIKKDKNTGRFNIQCSECEVCAEKPFILHKGAVGETGGFYFVEVKKTTETKEVFSDLHPCSSIYLTSSKSRRRKKKVSEKFTKSLKRESRSSPTRNPKNPRSPTRSPSRSPSSASGRSPKRKKTSSSEASAKEKKGLENKFETDLQEVAKLQHKFETQISDISDQDDGESDEDTDDENRNENQEQQQQRYVEEEAFCDIPVTPKALKPYQILQKQQLSNPQCLNWNN
tara:strand:- start:75 stop:962 length:888 start_codon:yes stop_codon:yes gene_type:complete